MGTFTNPKICSEFILKEKFKRCIHSTALLRVTKLEELEILNLQTQHTPSHGNYQTNSNITWLCATTIKTNSQQKEKRRYLSVDLKCSKKQASSIQNHFTGQSSAEASKKNQSYATFYRLTIR